MREISATVFSFPRTTHAGALIFASGHPFGDSAAKQVEAARRSTAKLGHLPIGPLRRYLEREIEVARLAVEVAAFPETGPALPGFEPVMELRNAILAWERGHLGQVNRFVPGLLLRPL